MSFKPTRTGGLPANLAARIPKRNNPEFEQQCAIFTWARNPAVLRSHPELHLLSSSLNGVALTKAQAGKAYASGMLRGWPDIQLPVARGGYIGLSIEMKAGKNKPTDDQLRIGELLQDEGWCVRYFWDWLKARDEILLYLSAESRP